MPPIWVAQTPVISLSASSTKTLVQVYGNSAYNFIIKEIGVSFNGVDATKTPIQIDLLTQTTAGTMTSLTLFSQDRSDPSSSAMTAQHTATAEPTAGDIIRSWFVTPAGGTFVFQWPMGDEPVIAFDGYVGLRAITASGVSCGVLANMVLVQ